MPASIYSMSPCKINTTVVPVEKITLTQGVIASSHIHSGNEYPSLIIVPGADPRITLSMPFRAAYDLIGLTVLSATAFELCLAKFASLIRSASAVHTKWALSTSCTAAIQITGASVNQDGILMAEVEVVPLSVAGTAVALTRTDNNAILTLASQPILHTLGPVSINGTVVPGLASSSIDLGQQLEVVRHDGTQFPIVAARISGNPKLSAVHTDPVALESRLGALLGASITSNVVAYFRQYSATTGLVDSGATAVSVTIASGRIHGTAISGEQGAIATGGIEVIGTSTTSTHPMAVAISATAPAIP